jgi:hypothetical protein
MANYNSRTVDPRGNFFWQAATPHNIDKNVYDSIYQNIAATSADPVPLPLGLKIRTFDGREFTYVKYTDAGASAAEGNVLRPIAATNVTNVGASSADGLELPAGTGLTVGAWRGFFVYVEDSTGEGQTRRIVWNSTTTLYLERALTTATASGSDLYLWSPWSVARTTTAAGLTQVVTGVSIGAITTAQYGWAQTLGFSEMVLLDSNTVPALDDTTALVPSGTVAGTATAITAGETADDVNIFAKCLQVPTAVSKGVPAWLNSCQG